MSGTSSIEKAKNLLHFTDADFKTEVLESDRPVLVDFWADWCGPCHALAPTIEELAGKFEGAVKVGKLDIDQNLQTARAYGIRGIPAVLLFRNGEVAETLVGVQPKRRYEEVLERALEGGRAGDDSNREPAPSVA